jgi:hypothetical protein
VLETMFFVVPVHSDGDETSQPAVEGKMTILTGEMKIDLYVLLPETLGLALASNFLGKEPDDIAGGELLDLTREMINMIGGNLVTKLDDERVSLGLPESRFLEGSALAYDAPENKIVLFIDDMPLQILWHEEPL